MAVTLPSSIPSFCSVQPAPHTKPALFIFFLQEAGEEAKRLETHKRHDKDTRQYQVEIDELNANEGSAFTFFSILLLCLREVKPAVQEVTEENKPEQQGLDQT